MPKSKEQSVIAIDLSKIQPNDVSTKLWMKTLNKKQRRELLWRWLEERGLPNECQKDILSHTSNEDHEAMRQYVLSVYMASEWGTKPYLCYSPGTKAAQRMAKSRKRAKEKSNYLSPISHAENSSDLVDSTTIVPPPSLSTMATIENFSDAIVPDN